VKRATLIPTFAAVKRWPILVIATSSLLVAAPVAALSISGQVLGAGSPIAGSTVSLWAANSGAPKQLAQVRSGADGHFVVNASGPTDKDASLYLVAKGGHSGVDKSAADNPAIVLMAVIGNHPPARVTINELTTIASAWTHNQFIDGTAIQGPPLALRIAASHVPSFVDLATGGYGQVIGDALNSAQTPTLANFATLANVLAGCVARLKADACRSVFAAARGLAGSVPTDTLAAAEAIARYPAYQPERMFALLDVFYPTPPLRLRPTPYLPYLSFAPSAWLLPLKYTGGGYSGGGKLMFDSQGNAWIANNFTVGAQNQDHFSSGSLSKFAPDGKALSPAITGFTGGGLLGPGFGLTLDAHDDVWITSTSSNTISKFDHVGKPLSPSQGYNLNGQISKMQGIISTPGGDIWAIDMVKSQLVHLPHGEPAKAQLFCQNKTGDPLKNPCKLLAPFALAIDQSNHLWITNLLGSHVTRIAAADPGKVDTFKTGYSGSGLAVDSLGNVWVTNKLGSSPRGAWKQAEMALAFKANVGHDVEASTGVSKALVDAMTVQKPGYEGGSMTVLRPDGSEASFSPVYGKGIAGPWAVAIDGNDNVWISNLTSASAGIVHLCGFRTENCPPGMKTGDAISPPGGYVGGGMQLQADVGIGPAGDVWVTNNWQHYPAAFGKVDEALQTLGAGQGVVVFHGMAKPVKVPMIGPVRAP